MLLSPEVKMLINHIHAAGGTPMVIGGSVRDHVLGILTGNIVPPKDIDIEVFGVDQDRLNKILKTVPGIEHCDTVGECFAVNAVRINGQSIDVSLPRTERKIASGHTGFDVTVNPHMSFKDACKRRDFTMNAIMFSPIQWAIVDECGGIRDLGRKTIRMISERAFIEDPLRVLRAMQFAARFGFDIDTSTAKHAQSISDKFSELTQDRVRTEWLKWAEKSTLPSKGIDALKATGWLQNFPEVAAMDGVEQEAEWHPEGDVLEHTKHVLDAMAAICEHKNMTGDDKVILMFAALCHDMGKPGTTETKEINGVRRITAHGHDVEGMKPATEFMSSLFKTEDQKHDPLITRQIAVLTELHMQPHEFGGSKKQVRRWRRKLHDVGLTLEHLMCLCTADHNGRPFNGSIEPHDKWDHIEAVAATLKDPVEDILMGRHLIARGMKPGKEFGVILNAAREAQLEGVFEDLEGALSWLTNHMTSTGSN